VGKNDYPALLAAADFEIGNGHGVSTTVVADLRRVRYRRQLDRFLSALAAFPGEGFHFHWNHHQDAESLVIVDKFNGRVIRIVIAEPKLDEEAFR